MRRALGVLLVAPPLLFAGTIFALSLFLQDYRCGDTCSVMDPDWRRSEDASQWDLMPWIGAGVLAIAAIFAVCVWLGRHWLALGALVLGASASISFVSWISPGWHENVTKEPLPLLLGAAAFAAGVVATVVTKRPRGRTG